MDADIVVMQAVSLYNDPFQILARFPDLKPDHGRDKDERDPRPDKGWPPGHQDRPCSFGTCRRAQRSSAFSCPAPPAPGTIWSRFDTSREGPAIPSLLRSEITGNFPAVSFISVIIIRPFFLKRRSFRSIRSLYHFSTTTSGQSLDSAGVFLSKGRSPHGSQTSQNCPGPEITVVYQTVRNNNRPGHRCQNIPDRWSSDRTLRAVQ